MIRLANQKDASFCESRSKGADKSIQVTWIIIQSKPLKSICGFIAAIFANSVMRGVVWLVERCSLIRLSAKTMSHGATRCAPQKPRLQYIWEGRFLGWSRKQESLNIMGATSMAEQYNSYNLSGKKDFYAWSRSLWGLKKVDCFL